jgi:unsaturated chondroitin disaccharide hydrolase
LKTHFQITGHKNLEPLSACRPEQLAKVFSLCVSKTRVNIKLLADEPKSGAWAVDGNYFAFPEGFYDIGNWTSSFFTGMALMAWEATEDPYFLQQTRRLGLAYCDKVFKHHEDTMHDLGFLYSLYSVALYKRTHDKLHREVGLRAADLLARRFLAGAGCIRAWGRMDSAEFEDMAIIDCLMNLPLLYWASEQTGHPRYAALAVSHADTALKFFVRADDSVYHAYRFDLSTGQGLVGDTYGGCAVESQWARGAAWAIYGFALSYKYTRMPKYLDAAQRIAKNFIANLDDEVIPAWDFRLPPEAARLRDASAASVAVCGLQEILKHTADNVWAAEAKTRLLARLCSEDYLNSNIGCRGVQKYGQVGNGIPGGAQNAYTSWGDYFLMEALARELFQFEPWW